MYCTTLQLVDLVTLKSNLKSINFFYCSGVVECEGNGLQCSVAVDMLTLSLYIRRTPLSTCKVINEMVSFILPLVDYPSKGEG